MKRLISFFSLFLILCSPGFSADKSIIIPADVFEKAGLSKLSSEELDVLKAWIQGNQIAAETSSEKVIVEDALPKGDDAFGVEQVESRMAEIIKAPSDRIETRIRGKLRGWGGGTHFYLQNGQVWKQIDNSSMRYNLDDAEVVLFKGAMGTYFLKPIKLNSRVRVRRVK